MGARVWVAGSPLLAWDILVRPMKDSALLPYCPRKYVIIAHVWPRLRAGRNIASIYCEDCRAWVEAEAYSGCTTPYYIEISVRLSEIPIVKGLGQCPEWTMESK